MQQIDSEDANFLFMEKVESPTHISLVYLYDQSELGAQQVRFTHILEHIPTGSMTTSSIWISMCATWHCPSQVTGASSVS